MTFRLTVAPSIADLVDPLAWELSRPLADPFSAELVAVPGDGIRSWLTAGLARRLGATPAADGISADGIVANVRFVFPSTVVEWALGRPTPSRPWSVGSLTWAIHDVLRADGGIHAERLGLTADAVRCRAIADLFDRYALHRSHMVAAWERGVDVDADGGVLPPHLVWQPALWRLVAQRLGVPSDVQAMAAATEQLRSGQLSTEAMPERVFLVGLASVPGPHLRVISALAERIDVHVLTPAPSMAVWDGLRRHVAARPLIQPLRREHDETAGSVRHPLNVTWGRAAREAHLLLADVAVHSRAGVVTSVASAASIGSEASVASEGAEGSPASARPPGVAPSSLLVRLQDDIRADRPPPRPPADGDPDERFELRADDHSLRWHTCHGPTRQAEVLRDVVLHLIHGPGTDRAGGSPRYLPRDITILCPDVPTFAPLVDAAFAGDLDRGMPAIPLRVADRSLRQENPLVDAVAALLGLLDGRLRASDVTAFAELAPVSRRFGLGPDEQEQIVRWVDGTNVRWGVDTDAHRRVGLPDGIGAHTWRDGLDQLLVGAALSDHAMAVAAGDMARSGAAAGNGAGGEHRFGPGGTVPAPDVEGDAVATAGALADLVDELSHAVDRLCSTSTVHDWCRSLIDAVDALFEVADVDSWQRRDLDAALGAFADEATIADEPLSTPVPPTELAALLLDRLSTTPGHVRFGTGAVTLSSLTAQRGVPAPVVCLLGLDDDLGSTEHTSPDDLTQTNPCVGDREARGELRAQLLDAVLAAKDRLVLVSTGRDVRTNARVPMAVPLAELAEVVDDTARVAHERGMVGTGRSAMRSLTVEHPRQAWANVNFQPGALGVDGAWSFDAGALDAATARKRQREVPPLLTAPLAPLTSESVRLSELVTALRNPAEILIRHRLGVSIDDDTEPLSDLLPLDVKGLDGWRLTKSLLAARLAAGSEWGDDALGRWAVLQRRSGILPPLARGDVAVAEARNAVEALIQMHDEHCGEERVTEPGMVSVDATVRLASGDRRVTGTVDGVRGTLVVGVSPTTLKPSHLLAMWVRAAALTVCRPDCDWEVVEIGRGERSTAVGWRVRLRSPETAHDALAVAVDLHERAMNEVVPAFPITTRALWSGNVDVAGTVWRGFEGRGESADRWIHTAVGPVDLADLLAESPRAHETWPDEPAPAAGSSRIEVWAQRIWGAFERTAVFSTEVPGGIPEPADLSGDRGEQAGTSGTRGGR